MGLQRVRYDCVAEHACMHTRSVGGSGDVVADWETKGGSCCSVAQLCPTLLQPHGLNLPGSSVNGILQARIQEWIAICFSRVSSDPGLEPAFTGGFFTTEPPGNPHCSPLGFSDLFLLCLGQTPGHVEGGGGGGLVKRRLRVVECGHNPVSTPGVSLCLYISCLFLTTRLCSDSSLTLSLHPHLLPHPECPA